MSKKPIKSSLFRFVTLRSPQLVEDKDTGFVAIPDAPSHDVKAGSVYYTAVDGITDEAARKTALKNAVFTPLESRAAAKAVNADLYAFSSWLMKNKNYLSYKSISDNLSAAYLADDTAPYDDDISLTLADEITIWDNLFYQTIHKTSSPIREACIQILIANKFMAAFKAYHDLFTGGEGEIVFTEEDENQFIKRANASVVISKEVLLSNESDNNQTEEALPKTTVNFLRNELEAFLAENAVADYQIALEEIEKEEALYDTKNKEAYDAALATYNASVATAFSTTKTTDAEGKIVYPGLDLPTFSPPAKATLDFQDASGEIVQRSGGDPTSFLSDETKNILSEDAFKYIDNFADATKVIKELISKEENKASNKIKNSKKVVKIGGSTLKLDPIDIIGSAKYCYAGYLERHKKTITGALVNAFMNISTKRDAPFITSSSASLVHDDTQQSFASTGGESIPSNNQNAKYKFLFGTIEMPYGLYTFSGTLNFSNGDAVDFSTSLEHTNKRVVNGIPVKSPFSGCGSVQGSSNPDDDVNQDIAILNLKGVQSLGIADFRRVEQEICCYVPGEVSHIENILAREYKEKATRSLVSSEITSEQTRETEIENLTDTTSTERNELQNEVSSVVDQDSSQSYGANASISGGWGDNYRFTAGTNFDASSSSSSSVSNSEAQTYAQEVTERALERVVQKVSSKRTSRVLREFEENNKHGFDNTKGEKHITGVYRWVDKVYKNQIVNYGKRLLYEFSIPEPSRVLKELLYIKEGAATTKLNLIEPTLPENPFSMLINGSLFSAKMINRSNYQEIASKFGATVSSVPEASMKISGGAESNYTKGGFTPDSGGFGYFTSGTEQVSIPDGYEVHEAKASVSFNYHPRDIENASYSIQIGGKSHHKNTNQVYYDSQDIAFNGLGGIQNELVLSYESFDTGTLAISFSATCQLTDEAYQQWQNETYDAIIAAYKTRVDEYNDFQRAEQNLEPTSEGSRLTFNPLFNRSIEKRELKRLAIELLTKSTNITISRNSYTDAEEKSEIVANDGFERHASVVRFFEQAFDWEIMAYQLYPYYYSNKDNWKDLIQEQEEADPIFQAFLQSGMARMVAPVRPGFETAVNWYMSTGEIWNGQGLVTDINDELYLSVADEMLDPVGQPVGEPWETRVPTSLTLVQAKSAYLDEGGLPCDSDCLTPADTIKETDFVISGGEGSNASSGVGSDTIAEDNNVT